MSKTNTKHIVHSFDDELKQLSAMIFKMGGLVEAQVAGALTIIKNPDPAMAKKIRAEDKKIDASEMEINNFAYTMIARRQPMAQDLRSIICTFKIATDLERIGDIAAHVATLISDNLADLPRNMNSGIRHMGKLLLKQVGDSLDAFSNNDEQKALIVWQGDQELDDLYHSVLRETMTYVMEEPKLISKAIDVIFVAKYIERAGDHITSIAENVVYIKTGKMLTDRPKGKRKKSSAK